MCAGFLCFVISAFFICDRAHALRANEVAIELDRPGVDDLPDRDRPGVSVVQLSSALNNTLEIPPKVGDKVRVIAKFDVNCRNQGGDANINRGCEGSVLSISKEERGNKILLNPVVKFTGNDESGKPCKSVESCLITSDEQGVAWEIFKDEHVDPPVSTPKPPGGPPDTGPVKGSRTIYTKSAEQRGDTCAEWFWRDYNKGNAEWEDLVTAEEKINTCAGWCARDGRCQAFSMWWSTGKIEDAAETYCTMCASTEFKKKSDKWYFFGQPQELSVSTDDSTVRSIEQRRPEAPPRRGLPPATSSEKTETPQRKPPPQKGPGPPPRRPPPPGVKKP